MQQLAGDTVRTDGAYAPEATLAGGASTFHVTGTVHVRFPDEVHHSLAYRAVKRGLDIVLSGVLLILLLPVLVAAVVVVKASGLPLFFRQERVGRHGRPFTIYKFDTMRRAEFKLCVEWEDDRVPPACRWLRTFRIDELPQLWNILRGDMTLIGPRPLPVSVVEDSRNRPGYALREAMRPGLTGWAKVRSPNSHFTLDPQMLIDDVEYVRKAGFLFDLRILAATPFAVIRGLLLFRAAAAEANASAAAPATAET